MYNAVGEFSNKIEIDGLENLQKCIKIMSIDEILILEGKHVWKDWVD